MLIFVQIFFMTVTTVPRRFFFLELAPSRPRSKNKIIKRQICNGVDIRKKKNLHLKKKYELRFLRWPNNRCSFFSFPKKNEHELQEKTPSNQKKNLWATYTCEIIREINIDAF